VWLILNAGQAIEKEQDKKLAFSFLQGFVQDVEENALASSLPRTIIR
jgi:hypothetical protein